MKFLKAFNVVNATKYAIIFGCFIVFVRLMFDTYENFFNKEGENATIIIEKLKDFHSQNRCQFQYDFPEKFVGGSVLKIQTTLECEIDLIVMVAGSFASKKARKKFIKLSRGNSPEVSIDGSKIKFNIHTTFVEIEKTDKIKIQIENLNKKHV
jgi:hypothetical protein